MPHSLSFAYPNRPVVARKNSHQRRPHNGTMAWCSIQGLGFDARFKRMWNYYLAYCQVGFEHGSFDVGPFKLVHRSA